MAVSVSQFGSENPDQPVPPSEASGAGSSVPLCVDLDGTLVRTDTLWEQAVLFLRRNPLNVLLLVKWTLQGRALLKRRLGERVKLDPQSLPYHTDFLNYLRSERDAGRTLLLVTAADREVAEAIAAHLQLFSEVIATDGNRNLKGDSKRSVLDERFQPGGYDYAGNSRADLPVWRSCRCSVVVNATPQVAREAGRVSRISRTFDRAPVRVKTLIRAIRSYQWVKNVLIFLPILTSHKLIQAPVVLQGVLAFAAFSLCASSVYILNDLMDLANDRAHERKRSRPFAAGVLSIPFGLALTLGLLLASAAVSLRLPGIFRFTLAVYYLCTLGYSLGLKRRLLVDVFMLAGLYSLRVLAGSAATGIEPSAWLLAFCLFFFLSMALVKRFTEVLPMQPQKDSRLAGRGYVAVDLHAIGALGTSAGLMSVLVLALYINSPQVLPLYRAPWALWFLCPLLLYWISRVWVMAYRGSMHDDPIVFALRDRVSYLVAACCGAVMACASRGLDMVLK